MIKAVILDYDDTLYPSEADCFALENEVLKRMGRSTMSREVHMKTWGRPLFEAIADRSPSIDVPKFKELFEPTMQEFVSEGKIDLVPAINLKALDELRNRGMFLAVLTSRVHLEMTHIMHPSHELAKRIDAFYYAENMKYKKPDPRAFDQIEKEHGFKPSECVYVGDSIGDAQSAKGAGLYFIASLESGLRTKDDFAGHAVDIFIPKFPDIVEAVQQLSAAA